MVKKSNWDYDKAIEMIIIEWLIENFFKKNDYITYYDVNYDEKKQKAGIDVVLSTADGILNKSKVDVKVASTYVNSNLPTFAFETSSLRKPYLNDNDTVPGWFIDEKKETEYYLLCWIWADVPIKGYNKKGYPFYDWKKITKDNITKIELCLNNVQGLKDYLNKKGWTREKIIRQDEKIRKNGCTENPNFIDGIKFTITKEEDRPETPINIVIRKPKLKENALYVKEIRKEG